jgi:HEAT repeat protein
VRLLSIWALSRIQPGDERLVALAVPALTEALASERPLVRLEAAAALGDIGAPAKPAVAALKRLLNDDEPQVREAAAAALKKIGG